MPAMPIGIAYVGLSKKYPPKQQLVHKSTRGISCNKFLYMTGEAVVKFRFIEYI